MAEPLAALALARAAVDRAAHRRTDEAWLAAAWAQGGTRVLPVAGGLALVRHADDKPGLVLGAPADAPPGERYFLGVDAGDTPYFAVAAEALGRSSHDAVVPAGLREVGALLDDRDAGLLVHAVALEHWHRAHPCCARCGAPTTVAAAGHLRRCPSDSSEHYPRTDPAVIMTVVDERDRLLLGHQVSWPPGRFSTLAGFVEPGESLEQAVRREVLEEVAVRVGEVTYLGSQSWPFPSSLMLGFVGKAETTEVLEDGVEIAEARWFSRAELARLIAGGELSLPPAVSIARRLIEHWYGEPLPDAPVRPRPGP